MAVKYSEAVPKSRLLQEKKVFLICYAELVSFSGIGLTRFPYTIAGEGSYHPNNKLLSSTSECSRYIGVKNNSGLYLFTCPVPRRELSQHSQASHRSDIPWLQPAAETRSLLLVQGKQSPCKEQWASEVASFFLDFPLVKVYL